jgi:hypothetical protein
MQYKHIVYTHVYDSVHVRVCVLANAHVHVHIHVHFYIYVHVHFHATWAWTWEWTRTWKGYTDTDMDMDINIFERKIFYIRYRAALILKSSDIRIELNIDIVTVLISGLKDL